MRSPWRKREDTYRLGLADHAEWFAPMILGVLVLLFLLSLVIDRWGGAVSSL
jgi:hypothetical protein